MQLFLFNKQVNSQIKSNQIGMRNKPIEQNEGKAERITGKHGRAEQDKTIHVKYPRKQVGITRVWPVLQVCTEAD